MVQGSCTTATCSVSGNCRPGPRRSTPLVPGQAVSSSKLSQLPRLCTACGAYFSRSCQCYAGMLQHAGEDQLCSVMHVDDRACSTAAQQDSAV
jgi:hypothetical protein